MDRLLPDELWQRHDLLAPVRRVGSRRVFEQLQALLLDGPGEGGRVDLERVSVDSFSLRAVTGGT